MCFSPHYLKLRACHPSNSPGGARFCFLLIVVSIGRRRQLGIIGPEIPKVQNVLLAHTPFNIFTESSSGPHAVKILICSFFVILQNMRVAPVPLRICSL